MTAFVDFQAPMFSHHSPHRKHHITQQPMAASTVLAQQAAGAALSWPQDLQGSPEETCWHRAVVLSTSRGADGGAQVAIMQEMSHSSHTPTPVSRRQAEEVWWLHIAEQATPQAFSEPGSVSTQSSEPAPRMQQAYWCSCGADVAELVPTLSCVTITHCFCTACQLLWDTHPIASCYSFCTLSVLGPVPCSGSVPNKTPLLQF